MPAQSAGNEMGEKRVQTEVDEPSIFRRSRYEFEREVGYESTP